jgi:uncharacterized membrane protein (DUF373 family)
MFYLKDIHDYCILTAKVKRKSNTITHAVLNVFCITNKYNTIIRYHEKSMIKKDR